MKRVKLLLIALLLAVLPLSVFAQTGASIMEKLQATQKADSSAMDINLSLIEANGEVRERRIQTLTMTENGLTSTNGSSSPQSEELNALLPVKGVVLLWVVTSPTPIWPPLLSM